MRPIGYYVHHQGAGHWHRACAVAGALTRPCTLFGTFTDVDTGTAPCACVPLPDDRRADAFDGRDGGGTRPQSLHYAPLAHPGVRRRMGAIAAWIAANDPVLMIVDVSVEVALLCRLLSVPTLVVRLAGERTDPPHLEAFRAAERLIAPFPAALEGGVPDWVRAKTLYAGFLAPAQAASSGIEDDRIVVVFGRGGAGGGRAALAAAARAVPDRAWHVLGPVVGERVEAPPNLHLHGWVEDVGPALALASLVVGGGGDGVLAAVAAAGKRFLCLPEPRPYGEQGLKAAALARLGAAVVHEGWPTAAEWPALVARSLALQPSVIRGLAETGAVVRIASAIEAVARDVERAS